MFELYTWMTDNGYKARQMAEESGLEYELKPVNIREKDQFKPEFLKISPGHKIPAIIDYDGPGGNEITLCESGAILRYLAQKADNGLYPSDPVKQVEAEQWLFYGSAQFTTLAQQYGLFWVRLGEDVPRAKEHYEGVMRDMLGMYDKRLAENEYVIGSYSVCDIAGYPYIHIHGFSDVGRDYYPHVKRWHDAIEARPAVQKAWVPFG